MKIYLVGGAVRDALLKRQVTEHDFVVVGATPDDLLAKGFRPVGKDFPVFLHPRTQDEYALARTERKTGKGYTGFECFFDPSVTLEQDLLRRDLTINAMAQEWDDLANKPKSDIIDPLQGQQDLSAKILRHVSPAFAEDPVRILRVARFAARFPDFRVDPETNQLMRNMADAGEVNALVPERVWKEFSRALTETDPLRFFEVLKDCTALPILFPEFARSPLPHHHSSFEYLSRSLVNRSKAYNQTTKMPESLAEKNTSHDNEIPSHETPDDILFFGALTLGLNETEITTLCQRLRPPARFSDLAFLIAKNKHTFQTLNINEPTAIVDFLEKMDTYRRPGRLFDFCRIIRLTQDEYPAVEKIANTLTFAFEQTRSIEAKSFIQQGLTGEAIGKAIHNAKIERLK